MESTTATVKANVPFTEDSLESTACPLSKLVEPEIMED